MSCIFATHVFIDTTLVFVLVVVHNDSNILLVLFVPGYLLMRSVITGLVLVPAKDFYGEEADQ